MTDIEEPFLPVHPGQNLKRELAARGIKQTDLAAEIGILPSLLNEIIKGKRSITPDLSILLGAFLGCDEEKYNRLQAAYNLQTAKRESATQEKVTAINALRELKTFVPLSYFRKQEVLDGNPVQDLKKLLQILNVKDYVDGINAVSNGQLGGINFKKSGRLVEYKPFVNSWLQYVKFVSEEIKASPFSLSSEETVFGGLKELWRGSNILTNLERHLSTHGIKLVVRPKPEHAPLDGAAFWWKNNPVICLTLRHKRLDNLIFVVYHELAHVYRHLKSDDTVPFVDSLDDIREEDSKGKEEEANELARDRMIPREEWEAFIRKEDFTDDSIESFAEKLRLPGASILGRLCFEGMLPYSFPSRFKSQNQIL